MIAGLQARIKFLSQFCLITGLSNASNCTAALNADDIEFTPTPGFTGVASFDYTVTDSSGNSSTATALITLTNQAPYANGDSLTDYVLERRGRLAGTTSIAPVYVEVRPKITGSSRKADTLSGGDRGDNIYGFGNKDILRGNGY